MLGCFERNHRIAEAVSLPVRLGLAPVACVPRQAKHELVMTPILIRLIGISRRSAVGRGPYARRTQESHTDGVVVGLVGAVLAIGQNRCAEAAALVCQIDPAMRSNLELPL